MKIARHDGCFDVGVATEAGGLMKYALLILLVVSIDKNYFVFRYINVILLTVVI